MNTPKTIEEHDLHAYVDGELNGSARAEVEAWLTDHPEDSARVDTFRAQNAAMRELFDPILEEPVPERLSDAARADAAQSPRRSRAWPAWTRIAAAIALFAIGGLSGWGLRGLQPDGTVASDGFVDNAVGAHLVYVSEVRHPVEVAAAEEAHLVAWLSKRLGATLRAPSLLQAGYQLVGGRLLPDEGRPAAQFMYENTSGNRLTVYVRSSPAGGDTAFRFVSERGVSAFYWVDSPLSCALIGKMPREDLLPIARAVYEQFEK